MLVFVSKTNKYCIRFSSKKKKGFNLRFCNFLCHRAYEQIKINIGSMGLQVYLVAIGPGFSFPYDGPTHHGIQDISIYLISQNLKFIIFQITK